MSFLDDSTHDIPEILPEEEDETCNTTLTAKLQQTQMVAELISPIDAIDHDPDFTHIVAAGSRGVLKVFSVSDDGLFMTVDLRNVRSRDLKSNIPSNVAWSKTCDNLLATSSTNGKVFIWDLEKIEYYETRYEQHKRSATAVAFHWTDPNTLISGSKDTCIWLYDLRTSEPVLKFGGTFDSIRDLTFLRNQDQTNLFMTADDGGTVRIWDMRKNDRYYLQFPAHQGYVSSLEICPEGRHTMVTGGGRDKLIKIWDWSVAEELGPMDIIETMAPVAKVYFRPHEEWCLPADPTDPNADIPQLRMRYKQVASCAVVNDMNIHFWDTRRPFVPYASFSDHRDSCTTMAFDPNNSHRFVSGGKHGQLIMHHLSDAILPINYANDITVDTAPDGLITRR